MELTLAIVLALLGIATCAIVMAVMWGKLGANARGNALLRRQIFSSS
jgi:hypothetical protein